MVVGPHVTRPLRRFGWFAIATTAVASVGLSYATPSQTIGSFGIGLLCAGALLWIEGSPRGYPDPNMVTSAMRSLGVPMRSLEMAPYQTWGVIRFTGHDEEGDQIEIKVHGRDAFDSQLAAKLWHTLWYRETGRAVSYTRLQAVEHEALMAVMADRAGVRVPELAAVGSATAELALISFRSTGSAFTELGPEELTDELLTNAWSQVGKLHEESMSHGSLDASALQTGPGRSLDHRLRSRLPDPRGGRPGERCRRAPVLSHCPGRRGPGSGGSRARTGPGSARRRTALRPGPGGEPGIATSG